jgi:hypothetical protein
MSKVQLSLRLPSYCIYIVYIYMCFTPVFHRTTNAYSTILTVEPTRDLESRDILLVKIAITNLSWSIKLCALFLRLTMDTSTL